MLLTLLFACAGDFGVDVEAGLYGATALVTWTTDEPATSNVEFGTTDAYGSVTPLGDELVTEHAVLVAGMLPSTDYHLRALSVTSGKQELQSADLLFSTADIDPDITTVYNDPIDPAATASPMMFTTVGGSSGLVIIDAEGNIVWWRDLPTRWVGAQAWPTETGTEMLFNVADSDHEDCSVSEIHRLRLDGMVEQVTPATCNHHDFVPIENGNYGAIKAVFREYDIGDDGVMDMVAGDAIVELTPEGNEVEIWNAWDDLPVSVTEESNTNFYPNAFDWTHFNGLWATEDAYYVSSHTLSTVFKIDRATGSLVWRIGKRSSDFTFEDGSVSFSDQHSPRWVNGRLLVFNNTDLTEDGAYSYAVEYELDETTMTAREVRRYGADNDRGSQVLGNVDVLADDHWLVNFGTAGVVDEVDADNNVLRSWRTSIGGAVGNAHYMPELGGPVAAIPTGDAGEGCAAVDRPGFAALGLALLALSRRRARLPRAGAR